MILRLLIKRRSNAEKIGTAVDEARAITGQRLFGILEILHAVQNPEDIVLNKMEVELVMLMEETSAPNNARVNVKSYLHQRFRKGKRYIKVK